MTKAQKDIIKYWLEEFDVRRHITFRLANLKGEMGVIEEEDGEFEVSVDRDLSIGDFEETEMGELLHYKSRVFSEFLQKFGMKVWDIYDEAIHRIAKEILFEKEMK